MGDSANTDRRPSPDALLRQAENSQRGRLKIFLGAAPGVGKTYEMLSAAQVRRREKVDVVVGVVETHGRAETEALTAGLETVPRQTIEYRGKTLTEMDLDGILARRPSLVLVDELAHTNAPGSRHPKRYLDVEELLAAGIDVYTTLNIQHVESLNDVVAQITRIRVRETVPDSVIERANDIELIDLTPEDLIQRLKEGKVYVPAQAERAVRHYFLPGNLTALRELALRRTAQRVDNQMVDYMRSHAIDGPWPAGERVLVCVQGGPKASATVRHAKRLADQLRAPWTAIHVETTGSRRPSVAEQDSVVEALRLAQRLGAEPVLIPGQDVADSVIDYARANNVTHLIVGKSERSPWQEMLLGSITQRLIKRAGGINIHVIEVPAERVDGAPAPAVVEPKPNLDPRAYGIAALLVALAIPVAMGLREFLGVTNEALVFLTAILIAAVLHGLGPSLFACFVAMVAYNFFFLPPLYTLTIADPENVVALFFFAVVAVIASNLAARVRGQALSARLRARQTDELYQFSRKLSVAVTLDDLLWATAHQIAMMVKVRVVLLLPENGSIAVRAGFPPEDMLDDADLAAAKWSWEKNHIAGRGSDTLPGAKWLFLPLRTGRGPLGVVGIIRDEPGPLLTPDQQRLLDALADQAALAIERVNLARDLHLARLQVETDRLRSALLTSISHDLRTPLASILGSATSLRSQDAILDRPTKEALLGTIIEESDRLNRFIGNLLDMTRLESGALKPRTGLN
ncbi:MAG TPA: sensor histidine kinase KdpD [Rhodopila sp.]|nr:sensor histidine kinase KdpD [Rhodopila sp.]